MPTTVLAIGVVCLALAVFKDGADDDMDIHDAIGWKRVLLVLLLHNMVWFLLLPVFSVHCPELFNK
jgi:hypothetical protein